MKRLLSFLKNEDSGEQGQAIVEFALAMPLLLTLLCGILDFGWIYLNQYKVDYAAYAGARSGALHSTAPDSTLRTAVLNRVTSNLPSGTTVTTTTVKNNTIETTIRTAGGSEGKISYELDSTNNTFTVTVEYPVKILTFVAGTVFNGSYYTATATNVSPF